MELDSDAMQWQRYRASSRCESVTGARTAYPKDMPNRGYGERNPHQVSYVMQKAAKRVFVLHGETCFGKYWKSPIIKADLRERMLPHGKENFEKSKLVGQGMMEDVTKTFSTVYS